MLQAACLKPIIPLKKVCRSWKDPDTKMGGPDYHIVKKGLASFPLEILHYALLELFENTGSS